MMLINLLLIAIIIVNLIDLSGFIDEMEAIIGRWLGCKVKIPKPFSCSYCMTHHVGLIYLIFNHFTLYYYAFILFLCFLTPVIKDLFIIVKEWLVSILNAQWK